MEDETENKITVIQVEESAYQALVDKARHFDLLIEQQKVNQELKDLEAKLLSK